MVEIVKPEVKLLAVTPNAEWVIETAYLQCREAEINIEEKRHSHEVKDRIDAMFMTKHYGPLEHASATVQITGVSRAFSHQLVRHRLASYCQMSQRAIPIEKMGIIAPPSLNDIAGAKEIFNAFIRDVEYTYNALISMGIPKEDARFVLPNAIETQVVMTMNFRNWIHFLRLRTEEHAQWEIRFVANKIWEILKTISPNVFDERFKEDWE